METGTGSGRQERAAGTLRPKGAATPEPAAAAVIGTGSLRYPDASDVLPIRIQIPLWLLLGGLLFSPAASAQHEVYFRGKVILEDGTVPDHTVTVQRVCIGLPQPIREAVTARKTGEYIIRLYVTELGHVYSGSGGFALLPCRLEVSDSGYVSSYIDLNDRRITLSPRLPDLVLTSKARSVALEVHPAGGVPRAASRNWALAVRRLTAKEWDSAEAPLRAVVQTAPKFAPAWAALGNLLARGGKTEEARRVLERSAELDPKQLATLQMLTQVQVDLKDWPAVAATTERLIAADSKHVFVEAYQFSAAALYQMREYDKALARINDAVRFDRLRELKRADYIRGPDSRGPGRPGRSGEEPPGLSLPEPARQGNRGREPAYRQPRQGSGRGPLDGIEQPGPELCRHRRGPGAGRHQGFFRRGPTLRRADAARLLPGLLSGHHRQPPRPVQPDPRSAAGSHHVHLHRRGARAPGGARRQRYGDPAHHRQRGRGPQDAGDPGRAGLEAGFRRARGTPSRPRASATMAGGNARSLPWVRTSWSSGTPCATGASSALRSPARRPGWWAGAAWSVLLKGATEVRGGPAEVFIRDWRFARVYSGLGAMDADSAAALVSAIGLANLLLKYSAFAADYAGAIEISGSRVAVPGGARAEPVWARLAGANPQATVPFLRALFEKDQGRLLSFYDALAHADAAHQQFFTESAERAEAFYKWYRESALPPGSILGSRDWHQQFLQSLRVDGAGKVVFPGGREAWGPPAETDEGILLHHAPLEALTAITLLEQRRGVPFSGPAVRLLAEHYGEWRGLFGYFEKLTELDAPALRALEGFAAEAARVPVAQRNVLLGQWHSLVELTVLGTEAGTLSASQAEEAFRRASTTLRPPNPASAALAAVRALAGSAASLDESLASRLLGLSGPRREAYEELRKLQDVPAMSTLESGADADRTLLALSGAVYAARLDPSYLLAAEDQQLLRKHRFVSGDGPGELFPKSRLAFSNGPSGSHFEGGFAAFQGAAKPLRARTVGASAPGSDPKAAALIPAAGQSQEVASGAGTAPSSSGGPAVGSDLVFQARGRVVEVYATVTDSRGHYVDDLKAGQFTVLEEGEARPILGFENHTAGVSVALVFDTSGSMQATLPWLKSAALQMLEELRAVDSAAVYTFDDSVAAVLSFTEDTEAAKRAVLKLNAGGLTALYEALVRVNRDLAARPGKKVIVVFTDGADNASMLSSQLAIERARERGIPIYTIAQGEALLRPELVTELNHISRSTGGTPFLIRNLSDIAGVFGKISQDLRHGYQLAFQPSAGETRAWRKIEVVLSGSKTLEVRAREGYYVE